MNRFRTCYLVYEYMECSPIVFMHYENAILKLNEFQKLDELHKARGSAYIEEVPIRDFPSDSYCAQDSEFYRMTHGADLNAART